MARKTVRVPARLLAASTALSTIALLWSLLVPATRRVVRLPEVARREVSELNSDLYLPSRGPSPGIVLVLGALREGRRYPLLVTLARSIAACGYAVLVPELGRLRRLIVDEGALEDLIRAALALTGQDGVTQSPVGLFGFSLGGSLALVAAGDHRLHDRVACVTSMGGYFSLRDMLTAATTGKLGAEREEISLAAPSVYAIVASLIAGLPDPDRTFLERVLDDQQDSPLDAIGRVDMGSVGLGAQRVLRLLMNRDPAAVASLTRDLEGVEAMLSKLSPEPVFDRISVPVWVLHDERDRFVPAHQSRLMREAAAGRTNFKFFSIRLLEHTEPNPPPFNPRRLFSDYLPGLIGLFRFVHGPLTAVRKRGSGH
ncbi:MAG: alpha/beta hydrolase family protein [Isosphaeraceae bacterium]